MFKSNTWCDRTPSYLLDHTEILGAIFVRATHLPLEDFTIVDDQLKQASINQETEIHQNDNADKM